MKLYESENQIVIKGVDNELIKKHLDSDIQKILYVYDTSDNFLKDLIEYKSDRLVLYKIYKWVDNEWIIERHKKSDNKSWGIMEDIKKVSSIYFTLSS